MIEVEYIKPKAKPASLCDEENSRLEWTKGCCGEDS